MLDLPAKSGWRRVLPFRRSWIAIAVLAAFDGVFLIPAVLTFHQAASEWGRVEDLFDLVGAIFLSTWLLGWSIAPLVMTGVLALMLCGREVLLARPGTVGIFFGLPLLGVVAEYDVARMRNLRLERPPRKSGKSWRGPHLEFDYGSRTVALGSNLAGADLEAIRGHIETASGRAIRHGDARPEDLQDEQKPAPALLPAPVSVAPEQESSAATQAAGLVSPSTISLVVANLVPVFGAAFLGWNLGEVMVLYWAESAVIGFFNALKIAVIARWAALFYVPFFVGHFGGFMAVHFLFLYMLFIKGPQDNTGGDLAEVAGLFISLWPGLLALFISHGLSFFTNFIGHQEYRGLTVKDQMTQPYSRIVFMHLVLIFGGFLTLLLGGATPVLLIVIGVKIWFDIRAHRKERMRPRRPAQSNQAREEAASGGF